MSGFEGLEELTALFERSSRQVSKAIEPVVKKAAVNIVKEARERFQAQRSGSYLPHYAASIGFDSVDVSGDSVEVEIGPDSGMSQGSFGRGIEFGSSRHAPMPHLFPAADSEEPRLHVQAALAAMRAIQ